MGLLFFLILTRVCLLRSLCNLNNPLGGGSPKHTQQEVVGCSSPVALTFSPSNSWQPPDSSSAATNSFVPNSGHNASAKQATDTVGYATEPQKQHTHSWPPNLPSIYHGSQQQALNTAYNEGTADVVTIASPAYEPASQGFFQNPNPVTPSFGQPFVPTLDLVGYHVNRWAATTNSQHGQAYQLAGYGAVNDFDAANLEIALIDTTSFGSLHQWPNDTASGPLVDTNSFNSFNQWSNYAAIGPQADMNSFDSLHQWSNDAAIGPQADTNTSSSLLLPNTTYLLSPPALPTPFTGGVTAANANVNTNPNTCNYPGCGRIFGRPADLARHRRKHGVHQHPCPVRGCPRTFYRTDKLRDHQRQGHRMYF